MNQLEQIINNSLEEFDEKVKWPDELIPWDADDEKWLRENSDKHLFANTTWGEPKYDLDEDKVRDFLSTQIRKAVEEVMEKLTPDRLTERNKKWDFEDYRLGDNPGEIYAYNSAVDDLEKLKKEIN